MKILERRDPKKKRKRRIIEPLPFLSSSFSAAEVPEKEKKKYVSCSPNAVTKNNFKFRIFTHFLTNEIVLNGTTTTKIDKPDLIIQNSGMGFRRNMW